MSKEQIHKATTAHKRRLLIELTAMLPLLAYRLHRRERCPDPWWLRNVLPWLPMRPLSLLGILLCGLTAAVSFLDLQLEQLSPYAPLLVIIMALGIAIGFFSTHIVLRK